MADSDKEYTKIKEKKWCERTFSKMEKGSLRGSIIMLLVSALGLGIFALHKFFDAVGLIASLILIVVFCIFYIV